MLTSHTMRSTRYTSGSRAPIQAVIARHSVVNMGSAFCSSAILASASRHSSSQIELLQTAAGSKEYARPCNAPPNTQP